MLRYDRDNDASHDRHLSMFSTDLSHSPVQDTANATGRSLIMRSSHLRFLRKICLRPHLRPASHARELGITRTAVHHTIKFLKTEYDFRIQGLPEFQRMGMAVIFGWARSASMTSALSNFSRWLSGLPNVYTIAHSVLSSIGDFRVYFEALIQLSPYFDSDYAHHEVPTMTNRSMSSFLQHLNRFRKRPYSLDVHYDILRSETIHLNLALFDGQTWTIEHAFRLGAVFDAVSRYTDVLPQTEKGDAQQFRASLSREDLIILARMTSDYFVTASEIALLFENMSISPPTIRTIRRWLTRLRDGYIRPYVHIRNIGLTRRFIVSLTNLPYSSSVHRMFHAQGNMFPQCRILSGNDSVILDLRLPQTATVPQLSSALLPLSHTSSQINIFETRDLPRRKALEEVLTYYI
ncbi:MAG: hypothetical protein K9W43_07505 [Candidatus Thorarchaeota archaeon]|nr:hypothetical protein [Candidatus Thorarchaeota archaeon]